MTRIPFLSDHFERFLIQGCAFRMRYEFGDEGNRNRFWFVLNREPVSDSMLLVVTTTTRIAKRREFRARSPRVLVDITPGEFSELPQDSVVDCESAKLFSKDEILERFDCGDVELLNRPSPEILGRLLAAVAAARTLDLVTKRIALGPDYKDKRPPVENL